MANEIRARFNFASGTLSSSLTNVATSMSSAGLANLGVVDSTNHAAITIENEIVWVTAHTAGATTATIVRGVEGTTAATHNSAVAWQHGPTAVDIPRTDMTFTGGLANGTATVLTDFLTQNTVLSGGLPVPYTMIVQAHLIHGGNAVANTVLWDVRDEGGVSINYKSTAFLGTWDVKQPAASSQIASCVLGRKHYAAGATCGFRLAYAVTASNVYVDSGVRVTIHPRIQ